MASSSSSGVSGASQAVSSSKSANLKMSIGPSNRIQEVYRPFTELDLGVDCAIKAIICRSWDARNPAGKYIGTEYVIGDENGNTLHCVARGSIAHCVVPKLVVGQVYSIGRFTVAPNKVTYRLRRDDEYLIQLECNTAILKLDCPQTGFVRHPFMVEQIEDITFNDNAFLIDVVGRVTNLGVSKPTRNGSQLLEFELANERGRVIKVTLWGDLGAALKKVLENPSMLDVILLTAMNIRKYRGGQQLSSTSGTLIYESDEIPEIAELRLLIGDSPSQSQGTLLQVLQPGREQFGEERVQSTTLNCRVKVVGIRPRTPWYYNSCGERGCRKGLKPTGTQLWCESCEKPCEFPILRYLLRLEVSDDTTTLVVTLFDEIAQSMVNKSAADLMVELQGRVAEVEFPDELQQLVGTVHCLELKTHTYYNHGQYESFTVSKVMPPKEEATVIKMPSDENTAFKEAVVGEAKSDENVSAVATSTDAVTEAHGENRVIGQNEFSNISPAPDSVCKKRRLLSEPGAEA